MSSVLFTTFPFLCMCLCCICICSVSVFRLLVVIKQTTCCLPSARGSCEICSLSQLRCKWRHSLTWLASPIWYTQHQLATPSMHRSHPSSFWRFEPCPGSDLMASSRNGFWVICYMIIMMVVLLSDLENNWRKKYDKECMTVLCNTSMFADDFKPASIDTSKPAVIDIEEGNKVKVTVPHVEVCFDFLWCCMAWVAAVWCASSSLSVANPWTSRLEVVFAQHRHQHWSSVVHGCRLSATKLCQSLLPMSGTNYHATWRLHRPLYKFSDSHPNTYFQLFFSGLSVVPVNLLVSLLVTLITFVTYFFTYLRSFKSISTSVMAYPVTNQEYCKVHLSANNGEFARADKFSVDAGMRQQMILSVWPGAWFSKNLMTNVW